jgi:ATP-dependent RNA/DNA helicase IGHMBP2
MSNEYYEKLHKAVEIEKEYDKVSFENLMKHTSLHDRVKSGICWYPLQVKDTGYSVGEYPFLQVEMDRSKLVQHRFRAGAAIRFFTNSSNDSATEFVTGTVHYASDNQMKILLNANEIPDWADQGKLGVQIEFDEKTFTEMGKALKTVIKEESKNVLLLKEIFDGRKQPSAKNVELKITNPNLNESQVQAVKDIIAANEIALVHGPPGTGKTTTLVEAITQSVISDGQVLVTAPSNTAVDLLVEKLSKKGLNVVRVGNLSRIDEDVLHATLDYKITTSQDYAEMKKIKKQADEYRRMANKYKRSFGPSEREQRNLLMKEAKDLMAMARKLEDYNVEKIIGDAQVICTTLVGCDTYVLKGRRFHTCYIDEAAQALEPATWIPILKSDKVVLSGDPFQLPPTVKNPEAIKAGLSQTLMERLIHKLPAVSLLDTQYRMHELLMGYSNQYFYHYKLQAHNSVRHHRLPMETLPVLMFIDTAGCGYEEVKPENGDSISNPEEARLLLRHLRNTMIELGEESHKADVGIISPYNGQIRWIKENEPEEFGLSKEYQNIDIKTIDSFQGQERDIIYISLVRSNYDSEIGFLKDYRRMNVAMTRAKKMLVVIGDSATLGEDDFYKGFIDYCSNNVGYMSAWELME